jgi:hypothetical protein
MSAQTTGEPAPGSGWATGLSTTPRPRGDLIAVGARISGVRPGQPVAAGEGPIR